MTEGRLPAIVLTCERYRPFTEHMIKRYEVVWPTHPFTFEVPYQRCPLGGARVVSRPTPEPIRATVLELLDGFDDERWVYWCIDDRYPIELVQPVVARLAEAVLTDGLPGMDGILFCRARKMLRASHLSPERRDGPGGVSLLRRIDYSQIWLHQFLRVKVLRHLFLEFPESVPEARILDPVKDQLPLPADHRLYVVETNLAVFGESTTRGRVTRNCASSFRTLGLALPPGFEEGETDDVIIGSLEGLSRHVDTRQPA